MDLLQTLLIYMSLVFSASVQTAPQPDIVPEVADYSTAVVDITPAPTAVPTMVPGIDITPNPAYKTLKMGERGDEVRAMQEQLQTYGYYDGDIDGAYGNQTRQAVEEFQYMHGLSVDGIAGRHTLTVLFESEEIRMPQGDSITPAPTAATQLTVAHTLPPQVFTTFIPLPTATPVPVSAKEEDQQLPVESMEGYSITLQNLDTELKAFCQGETVYVPAFELLTESGVNIISSSSLEMEEYAFALDSTFVRVVHTEDQEGKPVNLQVFRNDEPQLVPNRSLLRYDDVLYVPAESMECVATMKCNVDDVAKIISVVITE